MALLALASYLGVAVWGSLTKWPPTLAMVLSVAFLWGAGVLLIWTTLLSSRHISEVGLGASVLLLGSSFLLLGSASLLTGGDPWLNLLGVVFLVSGIGGVLYAIGVLLGRAALRGVGFVIFGVSGLLFGAGTLLMTGAIMLGIGFLILGFGVLLHGASLLPDRMRAGGLALILAGVGALYIGVSYLTAVPLRHRFRPTWAGRAAGVGNSSADATDRRNLAKPSARKRPTQLHRLTRDPSTAGSGTLQQQTRATTRVSPWVDTVVEVVSVILDTTPREAPNEHSRGSDQRSERDGRTAGARTLAQRAS
jgi:hypothetical protein